MGELTVPSPGLRHGNNMDMDMDIATVPIYYIEALGPDPHITEFQGYGFCADSMYYSCKTYDTFILQLMGILVVHIVFCLFVFPNYSLDKKVFFLWFRGFKIFLVVFPKVNIIVFAKAYYALRLGFLN